MSTPDHTFPRYPRIAAKLYGEPWLMLPSKFQEMSKAFEDIRQAKGIPEEDRQGAADPVGPSYVTYSGEVRYYHPQVESYGPVALARVEGTTGRGLSNLAMMCGGFDTGLFREQLKNIQEDGKVKTLVILFNTPGGMAAGNSEIANAIRDVSASGIKVIGYTEILCASAGYWMACACDELHAHPAALVGSISTIYAGVDSSEAWAKEGYELKLFATGKYKATGMPGKKWTEDEEKMIWDRIGKIDARFKGFVSERRGVAAEDMEGQWWYAADAPSSIVDSTQFESLSAVLEAAFSL